MVDEKKGNKVKLTIVLVCVLFFSLLSLLFYSHYYDNFNNETNINKTNTNTEQVKDNNKQETNYLKIIIITGLVIIISISLTYYLFKNDKPTLLINEVDTLNIKDIIVQRLIKDFKIPNAYYDENGLLRLSNENNLVFYDQQNFKIKTTGSNWLILEVFIKSGIFSKPSGIHIIEIPRSEGIKSVVGLNYTFKHNCDIQTYIEFYLHRRKLPIFSYDDKEQRKLQMLTESGEADDDIIEQYKKDLFMNRKPKTDINKEEFLHEEEDEQEIIPNTNVKKK